MKGISLCNRICIDPLCGDKEGMDGDSEIYVLAIFWQKVLECFSVSSYKQHAGRGLVNSGSFSCIAIEIDTL